MLHFSSRVTVHQPNLAGLFSCRKVEPPKGYIEEKYAVIYIPKDLKLLVLQYLQETVKPEIFPKTIYSDIHGFIRSHNDNWMAYRDFYNGIVSQNEADKATTLKIKEKTYQKAIDHYTNALDRNLQLAPVYSNRGNAYSNCGDAFQAIEDYTKAIELKSDYAAAYNSRGVAYYNKGEFDLDIKSYNTAIELDPNYTEALDNRRIIYRAKRMAYYEENKSHLGVDYTEAIRQNPDDPNIYYNRGEAFLRLKLWDKARSDLITAKNMGPNIVV